MDTAQFTFHDRLNFFLPRKKKHKTLIREFDWRGSVKDMMESMGVPHAEIDLIMVNGKGVTFDYIVEQGDIINVYPNFDVVDLPDKLRVRPIYEGRPRFILDTHLGRLASYLRMMGFDTLYRAGDYPDEEIAEVANAENRIALTRDVGVLKRSLVVYGYYIRNTNPRKRIAEVVEEFKLANITEPYKFCMKCNGTMIKVEKSDILTELTERTQRYYDEFHRCVNCKRIYWKGSHYKKMQTLMDEVLG